MKERPEEKKDLSHVTILLVDDVQTNREILIQFLKDWWQIKPVKAITGKEAVEQARQFQFDLILMSIRIPEMDGYEATRQIKELPGYENTPVLALTADKNQEIHQKSQKNLFTDFLTKPFESKGLKQKIEKHLPLSIQDSGAEIQEDRAIHLSKIQERTQNNTFGETGIDISRYAQVAGEDEEVLRKLITISLRAMETYKEEFTAAAEEQDQKKLSDLAHKSTNTLYYIKADRLGREIKEFRQLLKDSPSEEQKLKEKKKAVLREMDLLITGLKKLSS